MKGDAMRFQQPGDSDHVFAALALNNEEVTHKR